MSYSYPIRYDWSTDETITIVQFFELIEMAYEKGVEREIIIAAYRKFKEIVPSKSEEKTLFREFEKASGYASYNVIQAAIKGVDGEKIKGKD